MFRSDARAKPKRIECCCKLHPVEKQSQLPNENFKDDSHSPLTGTRTHASSEVIITLATMHDMIPQQLVPELHTNEPNPTAHDQKGTDILPACAHDAHSEIKRIRDALRMHFAFSRHP
jgi:hypothetical protein